MNEDKLLKTCGIGNLELIKSLVEQGFDISSNNYLSLRYAVWGGHLEVILYLRKLAGNKLKCDKCIVSMTCMQLCEGFIK